MQFITTPLSRFDSIKDFPYQPHYIAYKGMKMHYIDEGEGEVILALHGEPTWSYLYRKFVPLLSQKYRFIAPDFFGFGKSDKPVNTSDYSFAFHYESLKNLIEQLQLKDITLVVQDWGGLIGLPVLGEKPELFKQMVVMNTSLPNGKPLPFFFKLWQAFATYHPSTPIGYIFKLGSFNKPSEEVLDAYRAPFPSRKYKAGAKAFPGLVPGKPSDKGIAEMNRAREVLSKWNKPALVLFSDKDKVLGHMVNFFHRLIPTATQRERIIIHNAGHFLQEEKGEEIAFYIDEFMQGKI